MSIEIQGDVLRLSGECNYQSFRQHYFLDLPSLPHLKIECKNLKKIDFSFAIFLDEILKQKNITYELIDAHCEVLEIFSLIQRRSEFQIISHSSSFLAKLGIWVYQQAKGFLDFFNFFGYFIVSLFQIFLHPKLLRFSSLLFHMNHSGFKALPVGLVTCAIVSCAISIQGVIQLQKMGVPLASVETMAKLALREMGPFILALVVAGRSASSFTAEIGVMRITEELDAMRVMGFDWYRFIVLPRFLALVIVMPLLVFVADSVSLFASALVIKVQTDITFIQYIERFYEYVGISHMWVGVIKAPFFGAVIALVGCYRGLEIQGNTQSVGKYTTLSVVSALFWIIVVNAIFSFVFTRFDL
ncbi:MlaE family ABC transporter permease [Helicobacter cholecystus]|uniref:MlaE family ABC transporter permease n=1 Tax=Helicobacter cholecystus TaxID=45498 RepID=UPI002738181B|nr:ABC transporter permease [Helicobacter cholecystus]